MKNQTGFNLIELIIVVAIVGILVSVAIPVYQGYVARSQVMEAFSATDGLRLDMALYRNEHGLVDMTTVTSINNVANNLKGTYIDQVKIANASGAVSMVFKSGILKDKGMVLTPDFTGHSIVDWKCAGDTALSGASAPVNTEYLPKTCL